MIAFLVDAQLPARLAQALRGWGFDAIHTSELAAGNRTPDREIRLLSGQQQRIVVTKDADFVDSFLLVRQPHKLLLVSTGNISNNDLLQLFGQNIQRLADLLARHDYVELSRTSVIVHE